MMDTSTSSSSTVHRNAGQSAAQRRFYQWVLKWISGVQSNESNNDEEQDTKGPLKPDVPVIACFLQALGFKLLSFEKEVSNKCDDDPNKPGDLTISLECRTSRMKAILQLDDVQCQCPHPEHVEDASFWSITGTEPAGSIDNIAQKVEGSGSNLLPNVSKDVARVLRDVSSRLFEIIACEPDINRNTDSDLNSSRKNNASYEIKSTQDQQKPEIGIVRSYTQPEMRLRSNSYNAKNLMSKRGRSTNSESSDNQKISPSSYSRPTFQRQRTYDAELDSASLDEEPRPSPPKITSSPSMVTELSTSLGRISLENEVQYPKNIAEFIVGARRNLDKALNMLLTMKPSISSRTTPIKDQDVESVKSAPAIVLSPFKSETRSYGGKPPTGSKMSISSYEPGSQGKLHEASNIQIPKARRSIESSISKTIGRRSMQIESGISKLPTNRRSFGIPMPTGSPKPPVTQLLPKSSSHLESNSSRDCVRSDSPSRGFNSTNIRTPSMLKPPTKISMTKLIPKLKPSQPSRLSTGIASKPRNSFS